MFSSMKFGVLCSMCLVFCSVRQSVGLPTPYQFAYRVDTTEGSHGHAEFSDGNGRVEGFYVINLGDGRARTVRYYADETGFHPTIESNEPGVVSSAPADAPFTASALDDRSRQSFKPAQAPAPALIPRKTVSVPSPNAAPASALVSFAPPQPVRAPAPGPVAVTVAAPAPIPELAPAAIPAPLPAQAPVAAPAPLPELVSVPTTAPVAEVSPVSVSVSAAVPTAAQTTAAVEEQAPAQVSSDATIPAAGSAIEKTVVDIEGDDVLSEAPTVPAAGDKS